METVNAYMMLNNARQAATGESWQNEDGYDVSCIWKEVLHLIHMCPHQEGQSIQELQTQLCGLSEKAIKEDIDYLATKGRIYPTVDKGAF